MNEYEWKQIAIGLTAVGEVLLFGFLILVMLCGP